MRFCKMQLQLLVQRIFFRPTIFPKKFYSSKYVYLQESQYISSSKFNHKYFSSNHLQYQLLPNKTLYHDLRKIVVGLFDWSNHRRFICTSNCIFKEEFLTTFEKLEHRYLCFEEVFEEKFLSPEEWSSLIEEKKSEIRFFSKDIFDTYFIQKCLIINNASLAISYFDCQPLEEFNFSALSFYLLLLGRNISTVRSGLFYNVYEILQERLPLPDDIISQVIDALCRTSYWELAIPHIKSLESLKKTPFMGNNYNCFAKALIINKSLEEGLNYLVAKKSTLTNSTVKHSLHKIKLISNDDQRKKDLMILFNHLQNKNLSLYATNAKYLSSVGKTWFNNEKQRISNGEQCHSCGASLNLVPLNKEMVSELKDAFEEYVVKGSDIFQNTTPEEWSNFKKFLNFERSFDAVVDGLNFFYAGNKIKAKWEILRFFEFLTNNYEKVLIVTRLHTKRLFEELKYKLKNIEKIRFFYLSNDTKDDVYILYGSLYSGMGCHMITGDYLRNYTFLMKNRAHLKKPFLYWQTLHQFIIPRGAKSYSFFQPYQYHRVPQYNDVTKSWHFPIKSDEVYDYFVPEDEWLCLRDLAAEGVYSKNDDDNDVTTGNTSETENVRANKIYNENENVKKEENENGADRWSKLINNIDKRKLKNMHSKREFLLGQKKY